MRLYQCRHQGVVGREEIGLLINKRKRELSNNGGLAAAEKLISANQYAEPFKADRRKVVALAVELDSEEKGLVDWKEVR